jgi:hypothetical protein
MTQNAAVNSKSTHRIAGIILAYPFVLLGISIALNLFVFGIRPDIVTLPSKASIVALACAEFS